MYLLLKKYNARIRSRGIDLLYKAKYDKHVSIQAELKHTTDVSINQELLWIEMLMMCVYFPPEGSSYYDITAFDEMEKWIFEFKCD